MATKVEIYQRCIELVERLILEEIPLTAMMKTVDPVGQVSSRKLINTDTEITMADLDRIDKAIDKVCLQKRT
jgi:hypothetical protein